MSGLFFSIGRAVCHQLPQRSIFLGGMPLPVCARCTGIYAGVAVSFVWLILRGGFLGSRPPSVKTAVLLALSFLPFSMDGLLSYAGIWPTNNLIRILTGAFAGYAMPVFLILLIQFKVDGKNDKPILSGGILEALLILCLSLGMAFLIYSKGIGHLAGSIIICIGILSMYTAFVMMILSLIFKNKPKLPLTMISFVIASAVLALMSVIVKGL